MKVKPLFLKLTYLGVVCLSIFALFFLIATTWIGFEVKNHCKLAQTKYSGDCVQSLSSMVVDEHQSYSVRNSSIWSLGQLGDPRALPVLEQLYTGIIPAREPLNKTISQYELQKAIKLVKGGINISAPFWRFN